MVLSSLTQPISELETNDGALGISLESIVYYIEFKYLEFRLLTRLELREMQ